MLNNYVIYGYNTKTFMHVRTAKDTLMTISIYKYVLFTESE